MKYLPNSEKQEIQKGFKALNSKYTREFLAFLFKNKPANHYVEIRVFEGKSVVQNYFTDTTRLVQQLETFWDRIRQAEVFCGVCARTEKKGTKAVIKEISTFWTDIDFKKLEEAQIKARIEKFPLKPNLIINSGHGYHLYWIIKEPVKITDDAVLDYVEGINGGLAKHFDGDVQSRDVARIMRIPGSLNNKGEPLECKIVATNTNFYSIQELEPYRIEFTKTEIIPINTNTVKIDLDRLSLKPWTKRLIEKGWESDSRYKSRSEADEAIMLSLLYSHCDDNTIYSIFTNSKFGISAKTLELKNQKQRENYLGYSLTKAKKMWTEKHEEWRNKIETFRDFSELENVFYKWLYIEDKDYLKIIHACVLSHKFDAKPVWILLVAPPSATKSVALMPLLVLEKTFLISSLTSKSLISGYELKGKRKLDKDGKPFEPSLLKRIGSGIIIAKDFTTILQLRSEERSDILQQLREIWDGAYTKSFGTGEEVTWEGKITFMAGCTEYYEAFRQVDQTLGERYLLYKPELANIEKMTKKAFWQEGSEKIMNNELKEATRLFHSSLDVPKDPRQIPIPENIEDQLIALSDFITRARTSMKRDYRHEVEMIPGREMPMRLASQLHLMTKALALINKKSEVGAEEFRIVAKLGISTIATDRYKILKTLYSGKHEYFTSSDIADLIKHPKNLTLRILETLWSYDLVKRSEVSQVHQWAASDLALDLIEKARI